MQIFTLYIFLYVQTQHLCNKHIKRLFKTMILNARCFLRSKEGEVNWLMFVVKTIDVTEIKVQHIK